MEQNQNIEQLQNLLRKSIELMQRVAKSYRRQRIIVKEKGYGNFVTSADLVIEEKLIKGLKRLTPNYGFIAEEDCGLALTKKEFNWIIDPIDGTTNFLNGFPYAISLALQCSTTSEILLGLVYDILDNTIYFGCKGQGSYKLKGSRKPVKLVLEETNDNMISIFGMPYDRNKTQKIFSIAEEFYKISADLKRIGPASLDICKVACGYAKFYFELDLQIWDIAAGLLILQEAGGNYTCYNDLCVFYGKTEVPKFLMNSF